MSHDAQTEQTSRYASLMCEISTAIYIEILSEDVMQYLAPEFVILNYLQILFHSHLQIPPRNISRRVD